MDNTKKSLCQGSDKFPAGVEPSEAFWLCLDVVAKYFNIPRRPRRQLKKRFDTLSLDQQQLVTQTWIRIGHLQDYGLDIGYVSHAIIVDVKTPLALLEALFDTAEQDVDAAIWQWHVSKELLDQISAVNAIEEALA